MSIDKKINGNKPTDNNSKNYFASLYGTNIPDGRYKISLIANKLISAAIGNRKSEAFNDKDFIFDYKFPSPNPKNHTIIPYYDILFVEESGIYKSRFGLYVHYDFGDKVVDGITLDIEDKGNETKESLHTTLTSKSSNICNFKYIPLLEIGGTNNIQFSLSSYDANDVIYKRKNINKSEFTTLEITEELKNSYENSILIQDVVTKEPSESWKEIIINDSGETIKIPSSYPEVKENTLAYIPRTKRKVMMYNGHKYNFFYEVEGGPFYRSRYFERNLADGPHYMKRYDSVPIIDDGSEGQNLLSISENFDISFRKTYTKDNNTLTLEIFYTIKDFEGKNVEKKDINYAILNLYDTRAGLLKETIDFKDRDKTLIVGLPPSIYHYDGVLHNEYLNSNDCNFSGDEIDIRPEVDETMTVSYTVKDSSKKGKKIVNIKWKTYLSDFANFKAYLEKEVTKDGSTSYELIDTFSNLSFANITIDNLDPSITYYCYFTFDSDQCIFNESGKIKHTKIKF